MSDVAEHQEELPLNLAPMLATLAPLPTGDEWVYELKWDGVRALIAHDTTAPVGRRLRIWSRKGNVVTDTYPELTALEEALDGHDVVLDGEIVAFDEAGRPSFNRIQERLGVRAADAIVRAQRNPVVFVAFDLLHLDGMSTRSLPWRSRRTLLEQLDLGNGANWRLSTVHDDGEAFLEATRAADLEGVVAKLASARYTPGSRSPSWVKVKNLTIDEFVIGGWVPGEGRRDSMIGALLLGVPTGDHNDTPIHWVGKAGTGFTMAELERLHALLAVSRTTVSPFENDPGEKTAVFVEARHRCRVEYREITKEGILRFPSYKGLVDAEVGRDVHVEEEDL
jgi:bifunctional non-homologous end joining protein LigD